MVFIRLVLVIRLDICFCTSNTFHITITKANKCKWPRCSELRFLTWDTPMDDESDRFYLHLTNNKFLSGCNYCESINKYFWERSATKICFAEVRGCCIAVVWDNGQLAFFLYASEYFGEVYCYCDNLSDGLRFQAKKKNFYAMP